VPVQIVYETHSITEDNEAGRATGWLPGRLSAAGRVLAAELGRRRSADGLAAVFCSDLARSVETANIAFDGTAIPVLLDWRLRECDYGSLNGMPTADVHADRASYLDRPYPGGESWRQATARVGRFLADLPNLFTGPRWPGQRVLVIGHVATRWGLEVELLGTPLEELVNRDFAWQPGWEYLAR
jgi:2,3-bisphosphoglycerate-dependent phosphoglycerate mutase